MYSEVYRLLILQNIFPCSVYVLFSSSVRQFMKSKQKAICEKLLLLPNKASVALRQGLQSSPRAEKVSPLVINDFLSITFSYQAVIFVVFTQV